MPCSQPTWVPVAPSAWRRKSDSSMRGSASAASLRPLSVSVTRAFRFGSRGASSGLRDHVRAEIAEQVAPQRRARRADPRSLRALPPMSRDAPRRASPSIRRTIGRPAMPPTPSRTAPPCRRPPRPRRWRSRHGAAPLRRRPTPCPVDRKAHRDDQLVRRRAPWSACPAETRLAARTRSPRRERSTTSPPSTASASGNSELGSACAIEPQTVPLLRVWKWPTNGSAAASSGRICASAGHAINLFCVTAAPISNVAAVGDAVEFGDARNIDQHADIEEPQIEHRHSDWPPARMRASSPYSASSASTSSAVSGGA